MDQQRWKQIEDLLQRALDLEPDQRADFLERSCDGDDALRAEVEALLDQEIAASNFMESPAAALAADQLSTSSRVLPSQISHYRIEARIGEGGMGEVYKAHDESLRRVVALKVLPSEFTADQERINRLGQEAFAASRLNHPNIVTIFEITNLDGVHFIAEELVEGSTLRELLTDPQTRKPRPLDINKTLDVGMQVAAALKAAHTAWIIHRDIKPENIMVRDDGLVKVLDFGIAKLVEGADSTVQGNGQTIQNERVDLTANVSEPSSVSHSVSPGTLLTIPGVAIGTASYMSPEQARGEPLDGRSDLFSLGLVLFEMVTGERLFTGPTRAELLEADQSVNQTATTKLKQSQVPKELQRIIHKTLRPARDERYASAGDLFDELSRLKRKRDNRTARRIVGLSAFAVVTALVLVALAAFFSVNTAWEERILRDGHTAAVRRAVFSPDGRLLVSVSEDHQVIVWDFARRERLKTLTEHAGPINAITFSSDGKWFVTASEDQKLIVWDAVRLEKSRILQDDRGPVRTVSFSTDGQFLASGHSAGTSIWDNSWRKIREFPMGLAYGNYIFLKNNRLLAFGSGRMFELDTGQEVKGENKEWAGNWATISPDGKLWANVDPLGEVKFIDLAHEKSLGTMQVHHDHGRSAAFSPDGRWFATGAERVMLWDATTRTKLMPLEYESIVWSVAFSPDSRWLVSTHGDGAILVWDVNERELVTNLREHSGGVRAVAFSTDGNQLASASEDKTVIVWEIESGQKRAILTGHSTRVSAVAFSPDDKWLASADQAGTIIRWDVEQRLPVSTINQIPGDHSYCLAISPNERYAATSFGVFEFETGKRVFPHHGIRGEPAYGAVFSSDGRMLITASPHGDVTLINTENWQPIEKTSGTTLISVAISPDGSHLVTGDDEKTVRLWTIKPLAEVAVIGHHEARVKSVVFSPDGREVASAGDDKTIRLWDVSRRKLITTIGTHTSPIYSIAFSANGKLLISGEHDGTVRVYKRHRTLWGLSLD